MLLAGFDLETDGKAGEENLGITCAAIYEYDTKAKGGKVTALWQIELGLVNVGRCWTEI